MIWNPSPALPRLLSGNTKQATIGKIGDDAMVAIERNNARLKVLIHKDYVRPGFETATRDSVSPRFAATLRDLGAANIHQRFGEPELFSEEEIEGDGNTTIPTDGEDVDGDDRAASVTEPQPTEPAKPRLSCSSP